VRGLPRTFNARLRAECLNTEEFWSLPHARALIENLADRVQQRAPAQLAGLPDAERVRRALGGSDRTRRGL